MASKTNSKQVYRFSEVPEHPLAEKYGITERQARRAAQSGRLQYARPGGLVVLIAAEDIENWILGSRSDAK
ncbi:hypothetical protein [Cryobacterium arcticum]|uniref:DNA-binding protein n=1 Tax=Cryobacterium arcticum TaxID=670052 RepID=A0A317ZPV2_9MICO|nr:hypothetical protein [Cryobacterium arcticum]PXA68532.1 hypothetical protein CTB96_18245 [Cryobacterium arcticum]